MRILSLFLLLVLAVNVTWSSEKQRPLPADLRESLKGLSASERKEVVQRYWEKKRREATAGKQGDKAGKGKRGPSKEPGKSRSGDRRREIREKWEGLSREDWEKRRQELKGLSAEERKKRIRKWRSERLGHRPDLKEFTPSERSAKRDQIRGRLDKELTRLKAKRKEGALSESEKKRLRHLEEISARLEKRRASDGKPTGDRDGRHHREGEREDKKRGNKRR